MTAQVTPLRPRPPDPLALIDQTAPVWWDGEPDAVRAVLDLAWLRGDAGLQAHGRIIRLLAPNVADSLSMLAGDLYRVSDLETGLLDAEVGGVDAAENEAQALRTDCVDAARMIAETIHRGGAR